MFESTVASINSTRDSMGLKNKNVDGVGSFRNVPFLIYREQRQTGGRHHLDHGRVRTRSGPMNLGTPAQ